MIKYEFNGEDEKQEFSGAIKDRLELIRYTLPFLCHFDDISPLRLQLEQPVRRLRLFIPERGRLNLQGITFESPKPIDTSTAEFAMSSRFRTSDPPERLLQRRPIITEVDNSPWWEVRFASPTTIDAVLVKNRRGMFAAHNAALCIEVENADGQVWTFENAGPDLLRGRAAGFMTAANAFAEMSSLVSGNPDNAERLSRILSQATELHAVLEHGLTGGRQDMRAADALRLSLISDVVHVCWHLPTEALAEGLQGAAVILDYLLYRGRDDKDPLGTEDETRAVAVICASIFPQQRRVKNDTLLQYQRFIQSSERARIVDQFVSDTYVQMTGDVSLLPIMIRSHGISGDILHRNAAKYIASIKEIETIFEEMGYEVAICYGTLLGAARDKRFIVHDDDVDVIVLLGTQSVVGSQQELADIAQALSERGVWNQPSNNGFLKVRSPTHKMRMDLFPVIQRTETDVHMYMEGIRLRDVPRDIVLPFSTIEFYGTTFRCPARVVPFLEQRYGSTWNIPKRQVAAMIVDGERVTAEAG